MGLPDGGHHPRHPGGRGHAGRDYLVADEGQAFADEVVRLLLDPAEGRALGDRARAFVEEKYRWDNCLSPLDEVLEGITNKAQGHEPS